MFSKISKWWKEAMCAHEATHMVHREWGADTRKYISRYKVCNHCGYEELSDVRRV